MARTTRQRNPFAAWLADIRYRAKRGGIPFDLTEQWLREHFPPRCPVLGMKLAFGGRGREQHNSPSVDRIVPADGYVQGNCIIVSHLANTVRHTASPDQIIKVGAFYAQFLH